MSQTQHHFMCMLVRSWRNYLQRNKIVYIFGIMSKVELKVILGSKIGIKSKKENVFTLLPTFSEHFNT